MGDEEAIKLFGEKAKYGAVIIQTKEFAKRRYEAMLSSYSKEYDAMLKKEDSDNIQYILNNVILVGNYYGKLSYLDPNSLKSLTLMNSKQLLKKHRVYEKSVGVVIKAKTPKKSFPTNPIKKRDTAR